MEPLQHKRSTSCYLVVTYRSCPPPHPSSSTLEEQTKNESTVRCLRKDGCSKQNDALHHLSWEESLTAAFLCFYEALTLWVSPWKQVLCDKQKKTRSLLNIKTLLPSSTCQNFGSYIVNCLHFFHFMLEVGQPASICFPCFLHGCFSVQTPPDSILHTNYQLLASEEFDSLWHIFPCETGHRPFEKHFNGFEKYFNPLVGAEVTFRQEATFLA